MKIVVEPLIEELKKSPDHFKKAQIIDTLRREACMSVTEIAQKVGKHPSYISHLIRLKKLPPIIIDGYVSDQISLAHAIIISRLDSADDMVALYKDILSKNLTTLQTEDALRAKKHSISTDGEFLRDNDLEPLLENVQKKHKGMRLDVAQTRIRGKIILEMRGETKKTSEFIRSILTRLAKVEEKPLEI